MTRHIISAIIAIALCLFAYTASTAQKPSQDDSLRKGETRQTLDPKFFKDTRVQEAYRVAKEIPWVLDSIFCFCYCEDNKHFRHKSLLSCYVDDHASMWEICLGEALRAYELYKMGHAVKKIKEIVEKEFK